MNVGHCPILPIQLGIAVTRRKSHHLGFQYFNFVFFVLSLPKALVHSNGCGIPVPSWPLWDPTTEASNWRHLPWTWRIPWWEGWIHSRKLTKSGGLEDVYPVLVPCYFFCVREASCIKKAKGVCVLFFILAYTHCVFMTGVRMQLNLDGQIWQTNLHSIKTLASSWVFRWSRLWADCCHCSSHFGFLP